MKEINPLGSEKLSGDEKLKRILELTYYNQNNNKRTTPNAELVRESNAGGVFGIVREKDGYYVKRGLNEQSLDYIGGIFMKNKNKFSSYSEALKRLELLKGQEELQEATKYVLKKPSVGGEAPSVSEPSLPEAPAPSEPMGDVPMAPEGDAPVAPEGDAPVAPEGDVPMEPEGEMPTEPEGEDSTGESKRSDYMAEVQKFAGKLGQELRDQKEKMESDDIKYVLNMIISAVDLDKLEFEDLEEIGKKFEREEEESSEPESDEVPSEPETDEEVPTEPQDEVPSEPEAEMGEMDNPMDKLESFINTPIETNELDLSPYSDLGKGESNEDVVELDMSEIQDAINKSVGETLSKYFK